MAYGLLPERGRRALDPAYGVLFFFHVAAGAVFTLMLLRDLGLRLPAAVVGSAWVAYPLWLERSYESAVFFNSLVWLPLVLLLARRLVLAPSLRTAIFLGLAATCELLSGYALVGLVTAYAVAFGIPCWVLEREPGRRLSGAAPASAAFACALGVALLVSALQILPTLELASQSERTTSSARVIEEIARLRDQPRLAAWTHLIELPPLTVRQGISELWSEFGPVLVGLAILGPLLRPRRPAIWHLFGLFLLSTLAPVELLLRLPFHEISRYALEWSLTAYFAVHALAACGLDGLLERLRIRSAVAWLPALAMLGGAVVWSAWGVSAHWTPTPPERLLLPLPRMAISDCGLGPGGSRIFWPRGQAEGALIPARVPSIGGYEQSLLPIRLAALGDILGIGNGAVPGYWTERFARHRHVLSRMALECVVSEKEHLELVQAGFDRLSRAGERPVVYRNPDALPRARFAAQWRSARSGDEALRMLLGAPPGASHSEVILEGTTLPPVSCPEPDAQLEFLQDEPEQVVIGIEVHCPGYLVLADTNLSGWTAAVDDRPAPILAADYAFRAVALDPGRHQVAFLYAPRSARLGAALSALGLAASLAGLLWSLRGDPIGRWAGRRR